MPRNIEIMAKISQLDAVQEAAEKLAGSSPESIEQEDVFFHADSGRLKLRVLTPSSGQLIFYQRDDTRGPKASTYQVVQTEHPIELRSLLGRAYGEKIVVRKLRRLYLVGRTRIHIDIVEGLGEFLELEVLLEESEPTLAGENEALELMLKLGIETNALVEGAYSHLLTHTNLR